MRFYSQTDLLNYWEGGKSYRQDDIGEEIISDRSRTIPFLMRKYFEIKEKYDSGMKRTEDLHAYFGSVKGDAVVADALYEIKYKGGRTVKAQGVFLYGFIEDCVSLWENPLTRE